MVFGMSVIIVRVVLWFSRLLMIFKEGFLMIEFVFVFVNELCCCIGF